MSDHDQALAEREETRAEREADASEHHQRLMVLHYRYTVGREVGRRSERVTVGPWCPAGVARQIPMAADFAAWVMERHAQPEAVIAALFAGELHKIDADLIRYAEARAQADADSLVVEP